MTEPSLFDPRMPPFNGVHPQVGRECFVADTARVIGDVVLGDACSIWYGAVVRGDVFHIRIGARTNVQDLAVLHVTTGKHATLIGEDVTIGHRAVLHGCTVGDRALIGMGAVVMDAAVIGDEAMVGAGALVTPGTVVPPRTLVVGSPARPKRELRDDELAYLRKSGSHYAKLAAMYLAAGQGSCP